MALTWREVAAPDLSTSLRGYEMFGRGIENALGGLRETAAGIDRGITDRASSALMLQALAAEDPNAVRALTAGADPRRVNSAAIAMLSQRPTQILQEQNQELALKGARRNDSQTEAFDALASDQALAEQARAAGKPDANLEASIISRLSTIGGRNAMAVTDSLRDADIWGIDRTGKLQDQSIQRDQNTRAWNEDGRSQGRFAMDQTKFSWEKDDRDVEQAANILAPEIFDRGLDPEGIRGLIMQQNPRVRGALLRQASQFGYGNVFQPQDFGLSTGGSASGMQPGTNNDPWNTVLGNGAYGQPPKPLTNMSLGEVIDFGKNTLIPNSRAAGVGRDSRGLLGSSASGTYQITQSTLQQYAPKVLGANWRSQNFTPQVQDKIAQAIFNDNRGSAQALKNQWASLSLADAERVRNMPWDQARKVIAAGETSASAAAFDRANPLTTVAASAGTKIRNAQDQNDPVFQIYNSGLDKAGVSTEDVATRLAGGTLKGIPAAYMRDRIQEIINQSGGRLNPTQAGDLLAKNIKTNDSWYNRVTGRGSFWGDTFGGETNLAGGRRLNKEALDADIQKVLTGNPTDRAQTIAVRDALTSQLSVAQQRADAANAALARVQAQAGAGRNVDPSVLRRYQVNAATANAAALAIQRRLTNADSQPERSTQQQLPASTANPRNRFTGAPVRQGSLISQIYNDWFGS